MKWQGLAAALLAALLAAGPARAGDSLPPLQDQKAWTPQDKAEFLRFLNSTGAPRMPSGSVSAQAPAAEGIAFHAARSLELGPDFLELFPLSNGHYSGSVHGTAPGVKALGERHITPWLRAYGGLEYDRLSQQQLSGNTVGLTRWAIPAGLEFALVPLATPQTRYVLVRTGIVAGDVAGPGSRGDYRAPVLGASAAFDLGLGYEWQLSSTPWRLNAAIDGLRSISSRAGVAYYGMGLTAGAVYTF